MLNIALCINKKALGVPIHSTSWKMFICTACCIGILHYACQSIAYPEYFTQESAQVFTIENDRMVSFYTIADIIVQ